MATPDETLHNTPAFLRGKSSKNQPRNNTESFFEKNLQPPFDFKGDDITTQPPAQISRRATVDFTRDGDTVRLPDGSWVRLAGINTPELGKDGSEDQPFAQEAKARLEEILGENPDVTLDLGKQDKDTYNRTLAHLLTADGKNVQEILLQEGLAEAMSIEPNTRLSEFYRVLEKKAKENKVGMWQDPIPKMEQENMQNFPAPAEGYVPAWARQENYRSEAQPTAATPILEDLVNNITDDGLTTNLYNWAEDFNRPDPTETDYADIANGMEALLKSRGLPQAAAELIREDAKSLEHAGVIADRLKRIQDLAPGREAMGFGAAAVSNIGGFLADPINFIPGTLLFKGATKLLQTLPKLRVALTASAPTLTGKAATFAAFAVTEEALRTAPRLASDPTYDYEDYLINVGLAGGLGVGLAKGIPTAKWLANSTLKPAFRAVTTALDATLQKAKESIRVRTALNVMSDATKFHPRAKNSKAVKETLDAADIGKPVRTARDRANEQVRVAKATGTLKTIATGLRATFNKPDIDIADPTILNTLTDSIEKAVKVGMGTKVKGKVDIDFSVTARKVKDAVEQTDTKPKSYSDVMGDIRSLRNKAVEALKQGDETLTPKALRTIEAITVAAERTVEAAAARSGIKILRKTAKRTDIHKAIKENIVKAVSKKRNKRFSTLAKELTGTPHTLQATLRNVVQAVGAKGDDLESALHSWITEHSSQVTLRATQAREQVTIQFSRLRDDFELSYSGKVGDKDYIEARKLLDEQQDKLESLLDWVGLANHKQFQDLVNLDPRWANLTDTFDDALGAQAIKDIDKAYDSMTFKGMSKQFGSLTSSLAGSLLRTRVPLARYLAMNILELPAGNIPRQETAAILAEMNFAKIVHPMNIAWRDLMEEAAKDMGLGRIAKAKMQNFNPNTPGLQQDIARRVMKAVNEAQMGVTKDHPKYIMDFVEKLEKANNALYDIQLTHSIDGITGANRMKNYMRQSWHDGKITDLINTDSIGYAGVQELFSKSLMSRAKGRLTAAESDDLAKTFLDLKLEAMDRPSVDAFTLRTENLQSSMASIEDVIKRLQKTGNTESIENILKWVGSNAGGVAGYVNKRNILLDYSTTISRNGKTVSILDLLDSDVIGQVNRYGKEATGRSAISEVTNGRLNSEQAIDDFINAMAQQAHDLGTYVNTKDVRNVFRQMMGMPYDGQLPLDLRKIRDAVSLAGMNGLGESQIAEWGLATNRGLSGLFAMNQLASKTVGRLKQWKGMDLTESQKNNSAFLNELQEYSRLYEDMHIAARNNVHFDGRETQKATGIVSKVVDKATGGSYRPLLQYLQTRYTGYGAVRTMEEQVAMAGLMQDAMKKVRTGKSFTSDPRFKDIGLDLNILKKYTDDGTITLREDGNIETLNMHRWSQKDTQSIGVALQRHAGQQVQKGFAGEASALMTNPQVAMLMQFKSYPMLAAEKQMARSAMFADKEAGMGIALNAASSAGARIIRYYSLSLALPIDKREDYLEKKFSEDFTKDTAAYMGIVGMMMNNAEMSKDLVFGNETSVADQIPVLNWANNYVEAAKSANPFDEDGITERDIGNMQRGAPIGTILYLNGLSGIIRSMMDTDREEDYTHSNNRGN